MTPKELGAALRNNLFADRKTIDEAYEYAYTVAKGTDNPAAVMAALQVVVNTIANYITETGDA